jgi:hypothetical protein
LIYAPLRGEIGLAHRALTQPRRLTPSCRRERRAALGGAEKFLLPPREQDVAQRTAVVPSVDGQAKTLDLYDGSLWGANYLIKGVIGSIT